MLRKISGPKKAELSIKYRTLSLSNKRLQILFMLPIVVTTVKSTMRETRYTYRILTEKTFSKKEEETVRLLLSILERERYS
jgi:cAMP phosphodiesterase